MNQFISRRTLLPICGILLFFVLFIAIGNRTSAHSPHDRITSTLSSLGVMDAEFVEQISDPGRSRDGCLLYTSDSTQMGYYFEPDTGMLKTALHYSRINSTYKEKASSASALMPMQASSENRTASLLRYAENCIGESLIGELQLETKQDEGSTHRYTATEFYDGIETGTTVMFSCTPEGQITMVNVAIGSIFERAENGTYVLAAGDDLIGEDAAIAMARSGLEALDQEIKAISDEASCELTAAEDLLVYTVRISFTDGNGWDREYRAGVNAHTGELWQEAITK